MLKNMVRPLKELSPIASGFPGKRRRCLLSCELVLSGVFFNYLISLKRAMQEATYSCIRPVWFIFAAREFH